MKVKNREYRVRSRRTFVEKSVVAEMGDRVVANLLFWLIMFAVILVAADAEGVSPRELADRNNRLIVEDLTALGLSYDLFTRTTTRNHYAVAQEMFRTVHRNGYMVEQTTKGAISPSTGRTLPDRYIEGTCPICGADGARGDQCDNCGNQLDPTDLINPVSRINGEVPEFVETKHFFLDLPALADALGTWLDEREASGTWRPNVIRFSKNILEDIRPRAMTRDIDWGIPVPLEGWRDNPTKRLYVWFDAVIGYLSASVEWARRLGEPERWREWWNDPEALSYYFMGKDNITFHSQIWPAELLAYGGLGSRGGEPRKYGVLNLPTEVVSSEFLTMEGRKFSSSKKVVIYVRDLLARYQPDAFRYFVAAAGPENQDSDFTWSEFVRRTNDELVAGWGNLVNRTANMIAKSFGEIPAAGALEEVDEHGRRSLQEEAGQLTDWLGGVVVTHRFPSPLGRRARSEAPDARPYQVTIVGASGKLGRYMVRQCLDRGYQQRAMRDPTRPIAQPILRLHVEPGGAEQRVARDHRRPGQEGEGREPVPGAARVGPALDRDALDVGAVVIDREHRLAVAQARLVALLRAYRHAAGEVAADADARAADGLVVTPPRGTPTSPAPG